jgi:3-isopropylmalate dehydrogenase
MSAKRSFRLLTLPGDGIGPEVVEEGLAVLTQVAEAGGWPLTVQHGLVGGAALDTNGVPLTLPILQAARRADAVLLGAVGGPRWDDPSAPHRPEDALLRLRRALRVYANLRPVHSVPALAAISPLRPDRVRGVDLVVVRELTGGLYFGKPKRRWTDARGVAQAVDTLRYSAAEVERVAHVAFRLASVRRRQVASVDKANVLATSRLWREVVTGVAASYPKVTLRHVLVDTAAMELVRRPAQFDVILTENTFGDILTDEASVLGGSMGMLPSASLGDPRPDGRTPGLYEPIHGSAPDLVGKDLANPIATILSVAMLLEHSAGRPETARAVRGAVADVLSGGLRTADLAAPGQAVVGTRALGQAIREALARRLERP